MSKADNPPVDLETMFPGREVVIAEVGDKKLTAQVYPLGIVQIRKFNDTLADVLPRIATKVDLSKLKRANDFMVGFADLLPAITPMVASDLIELIDDCVVGVDLTKDRVPHWVLPKIVEIWIEESFGEAGKLKAWLDAIDRVLEKITGHKPGIWDTLCKHLSKQDTPSIPSSESASTESPTEA